jgi:hypothetical protein
MLMATKPHGINHSEQWRKSAELSIANNASHKAGFISNQAAADQLLRFCGIDFNCDAINFCRGLFN